MEVEMGADVGVLVCVNAGMYGLDVDVGVSGC